MKSFLWILIILIPSLGLCQEDPISQTFIQYETEIEKPEGGFKKQPILNNKIPGHNEKIQAVINKKDKDNGAMCLQAAKNFAFAKQNDLRKWNQSVYIGYKQRTYNAKEVNSGLRSTSRRLSVEIVETNSYGTEAELTPNHTVVDLAMDHNSVRDCRRKIEEAYNEATSKLKKGERKYDSLNFRLVQRKSQR
jgi:hypothetical protein